MKHSIKITEEISTAHILGKHEGKCRNLHGHNYLVHVTLEVASHVFSELSATTGMLTDFGNIKEIIHRLDHAFVYNANVSIEREFAKLSKSAGMKVVKMHCPTTAETLAQCLAGDILEYVKSISECEIERGDGHNNSLTVTVEETRKHEASVTLDF